MTVLNLHGKEVENVFDLLGHDENGMTYALGWALRQAPPFLQRFSEKVGIHGDTEKLSILLQESRSGFGRTDIEIDSPNGGKVVVEAKQGFVYPSTKQIHRYAGRAPVSHLVILTAFPEDVAFQDPRAPMKVGGRHIQYFSWRTIIELADDCLASATGASRRALADLVSYLQGCTTMQDRKSNMFWVVPVSRDTFAGGRITFRDVVEKYKRYFHPVGKRYPTSPPNYIAFRYRGRVQSIHFIEKVEVLTQFSKNFPGTSNERVEPHFLYTLVLCP